MELNDGQIVAATRAAHEQRLELMRDWFETVTEEEVAGVTRKLDALDRKGPVWAAIGELAMLGLALVSLPPEAEAWPDVTYDLGGEGGGA